MAKEIKDLSYAPERPINSEGIRNKLGAVATGLADVGLSAGKAIINSPQTIGNTVLGGVAGVMNAASQPEGMRPPVTPNTPSSLNQRLQGGQVEGGGAGNTNNAGNTGVVSGADLQRQALGTGTTQVGQIDPFKGYPDGASLQTKALGTGTTQVGQIDPNLFKATTGDNLQVAATGLGKTQVGQVDQSQFQPKPGEFADAMHSIGSSARMDGSTLRVTTPSGGLGSISFQDGRTLSPEKLQNLEKVMAYESLQSTKDKHAREAEIVAQRRAEGSEAMKEFAFKQGIKGLLPSTQALLVSGRDLEKSQQKAYRDVGLGKATEANTIASQRLGFDMSKQQASEEQANREFSRKTMNDIFNRDKGAATHIQMGLNQGQSSASILAGLQSMGKLNKSTILGSFNGRAKDVKSKDDWMNFLSSEDIPPEMAGSILAEVTDE